MLISLGNPGFIAEVNTSPKSQFNLVTEANCRHVKTMVRMTSM
jgi:hypothetical protein